MLESTRMSCVCTRAHVSGTGLPGRPGWGCDHLDLVLGGRGGGGVVGASCSQLSGSPLGTLEAQAASRSSWLGTWKHTPLPELVHPESPSLCHEGPTLSVYRATWSLRDTSRPREGTTGHRA